MFANDETKEYACMKCANMYKDVAYIFMNVVITCKLCQTVFSSALKSRKMKQLSKTVTESLSNFIQPGRGPVLDVTIQFK